MAKYYILLILLCSVIFIQSESLSEKCTGSASSTYDCVDLFTDSERAGGYYCCYEKAKKGSVQVSDCVLLEEDDRNDISSYIGTIKDQGFKDVSVFCKSFYLHLGVLSLLLILL